MFTVTFRHVAELSDINAALVFARLSLSPEVQMLVPPPFNIIRRVVSWTVDSCARRLCAKPRKDLVALRKLDAELPFTSARGSAAPYIIVKPGKALHNV